MRDDTWQILDELFASSPMLKAEAVDPAEVAIAEAAVGIILSHDYKDFVVRYGGAIVGPFRIFGLRSARSMGRGEGSFVDVTNMFRRHQWPKVEEWAIISMDHGGNPVGLDATGKIWISDHNIGVVQPIALDFEDYLRRRCLNFAQ